MKIPGQGKTIEMKADQQGEVSLANNGQSLFVGSFWTKHVLGGALLLVLLVCLAYAPVYHAGYVWDDDDYITENLTLRSPEGLAKIWLEPRSIPQYYPLVHTTFWFEYQLWGLDSFGYHLDNVLLHALNAILLWLLLLRLRVPGAFWAALLFALHPVHVESVAWITERKNVLSGVFFLAALLVYLRFAFPANGDKEEPTRSLRDWGLAFALFIAALLSKSVTVSFPAVIMLLIWWKRGRFPRRNLLPLVPMFFVGVGMAAATVWLERYHVGAQGAEWSLSLVQRGLIAGRALWFYAGKLVWPVPLVFNYPRWAIDADQWAGYLYPLSFFATLFVLWQLRKRTGRGPLAAVCLFAGVLFPALGFFDIYPMRYSFVADHFQYLASIGLLVLLVGGLCSLCHGITSPVKHSLSVGLALLAMVAGLMTFQQSRIYRDARTLWVDTIDKNPSSWMAYYHLGWLDNAAGDLTSAENYYRKAIEYSAPPNSHHNKAMNNLAMILARSGRTGEAEALYRRALQIAPGYGNALNNLGALLRDSGRCEEALGYLDMALEQPDVDLANVYNNHGSSLACLERFDEAEQSLLRSVQLDPDRAAVHFNLANLFGGRGRFTEAEKELDEVVRIGIDDPGRMRSVAAAYERLNRPRKAADLLKNLDE